MFVGATALQTYTQVFDEEGALDRLEGFASLNGAKFYGLEPNRGTITLDGGEQPVMAAVAVDDDRGRGVPGRRKPAMVARRG